jgi:hypothetical protein
MLPEDHQGQRRQAHIFERLGEAKTPFEMNCKLVQGMQLNDSKRA